MFCTNLCLEIEEQHQTGTKSLLEFKCSTMERIYNTIYETTTENLKKKLKVLIHIGQEQRCFGFYFWVKNILIIVGSAVTDMDIVLGSPVVYMLLNEAAKTQNILEI